MLGVPLVNPTFIFYLLLFHMHYHPIHTQYYIFSAQFLLFLVHFLILNNTSMQKSQTNQRVESEMTTATATAPRLPWNPSKTI